ncbi:MAG: methyltransferase family protein [Raoultibacter sp.]|jgi:protein-S-isoprenylcysteine O-methyltransferase Ste14
MVQGYVIFGLFLCLIVLVITRVQQLRKVGIHAMHFGKMDKKDFLIPPFVLLFLYLLIANVWSLPGSGGYLFSNSIVAWIGVGFGVLGVLFFAWALVSFGQSFRVGIDENDPGKLVTSGAFAISRNPIYVAFFFVLLGIFLVLPSWVFLLVLLAACALFTRQILLEEKSLEKVYGDEYREYCAKVRRFL